MNNPYAPPEDRPRADSTGAGGPGADGGADHGPADDVPQHRPPTGPPPGGLGRAGAFGPVPDVRPPDPNDMLDVQARTRGAAVLGLAGVLLMVMLPQMPWLLTSLPFAVAAMVQAVRALRVARRTRVVGPPRTTLGLLLVLSTGTVLVTLFSAALWPVQGPYVRCQQAALTVQAQQACTTALKDRIGQLGVSRS